MVINNRIIICWGTATSGGSSSGANTTLPVSFKTKYGIGTSGVIRSNVVNEAAVSIQIRTKSLTAFSSVGSWSINGAGFLAYTFNYICIGY